MGVRPQVDDVVLVVSPVEVHVVGVQQQEGEEDEEDLDGVVSPVHEVPVEDVGPLVGGHAVL